MCVAITFCDQAKHERRGNEQCYSSLSLREAESLPQLIEFETLALLNHEYFKESTSASLQWSLARRQVIFLAVRGFDAAEPEPTDSVFEYWNRKSVLLIPPTSGRGTPKVEHRNSGKQRR
jgi:hypothetical protein